MFEELKAPYRATDRGLKAPYRATDRGHDNEPGRGLERARLLSIWRGCVLTDE